MFSDDPLQEAVWLINDFQELWNKELVSRPSYETEGGVLGEIWIARGNAFALRLVPGQLVFRSWEHDEKLEFPRESG